MELPDFDLDDLCVLCEPENFHRREQSGAHVGRDVVKQGAGSVNPVSTTEDVDDHITHLTNQDNLFRRA